MSRLLHRFRLVLAVLGVCLVPLAVHKARGPWRQRNPDIHDGYGVRQVLAAELRAEGVTLADVPGRTWVVDR